MQGTSSVPGESAGPGNQRKRKGAWPEGAFCGARRLLRHSSTRWRTQAHLVATRGKQCSLAWRAWRSVRTLTFGVGAPDCLAFGLQASEGKGARAQGKSGSWHELAVASGAKSRARAAVRDGLRTIAAWL
ncbi:hypothetical protein GQ54DRAFT_142284 [Martensiomyces pterosporus]|nr:hypothetical protein GQ54DRAFT_142284 [Martensiomyces pterosporus]